MAEESSSDVQRARTRARQRLIGAAVLVAIGVIGFPLVFETQPRPIPVDIPIEIPRKEGAAPLVMPPTRQPGVVVAPAPATGASASASSPMSVAPTTSAREEVITESRDDSIPSAASAAARSAAVAAVPGPQASRPVAIPKPPTADARTAPPATDGARAQALLEGKAPAAASGARFVVQVGAFADAGAAREARAKVEALGLKTYTHVAETPAGPRTRVRVGPFASRDEADKALARARSAGLSAVVLKL